MSNNIYDRYTHRYLGKYLRFLRDYCNLNLMSMYNCFDGEILPTLRITDLDKSEEDEESEEDTTPKHRFTVDDKNYVFYKVPVISNQVYTMATDCALTIEMFCGYDIKSTIEPIKETYNKVNSCSFNIPFIYEIGNYDNSQNNLCIILKVPMSLKSSIVILEGDYSSSCQVDLSNNQCLLNQPYEYKKTIMIDDEGHYIIESNPSWSNENLYSSKPELLSTNNIQGSFLLATRMVEYLTENAITGNSKSYDIRKLQLRLYDLGLTNGDMWGVWDDKDREGIYKFVQEHNLNSKYYDVLSYFDKNVEDVMGGVM